MSKKLFQFRLRKVYEDHVYEFNYQVPANTRDDALIKIGQSFNNKDDKYELELIEG